MRQKIYLGMLDIRKSRRPHVVARQVATPGSGYGPALIIIAIEREPKRIGHAFGQIEL